MTKKERNEINDFFSKITANLEALRIDIANL